jgi:hypothetical protein
MLRKCSPLAQIRREQKMPGPLLLVYFMASTLPNSSQYNVLYKSPSVGVSHVGPGACLFSLLSVYHLNHPPFPHIYNPNPPTPNFPFPCTHLTHLSIAYHTDEYPNPPLHSYIGSFFAIHKSLNPNTFSQHANLLPYSHIYSLSSNIFLQFSHKTLNFLFLFSYTLLNFHSQNSPFFTLIIQKYSLFTTIYKTINYSLLIKIRLTELFTLHSH